MWAVTHIGFGTTVYDTIRHEKKWLRWTLLVAAGFVGHWLLDSTAVYHSLDRWQWWDYLFVTWQGIGLLWLLWWCGWKQVLSGVIAWLIWDIEWAFRAIGWVGQDGFLHKYLLGLSSTGYHFDSPVTAILEGLLLAVFIWLSRPYRWRLSRRAK